MKVHDLTKAVHAILSQHSEAVIADEEMRLAFRQKERMAAFGNAVMNLAGLPDETETMERWACAQGFLLQRNYRTYDWSIRRMADPSGGGTE